MTHYALLVGAGGWFPMSASGGTESTEDIGGVDYRVHKFTSNGTFTVSIKGTQGTVQAFLWGGGGGCGGFTDTAGDPGRGGRNGGGGGGGAYVRALSLPVNAESLSICVGGAGGNGSLGTSSAGGSGGSGTVVVRYKISSAQTSLEAKASGGVISFYNGKTIHTFTDSGIFSAPGTFNETVEYVVIGGGGGGANPAIGAGTTARNGGSGIVIIRYKYQ